MRVQRPSAPPMRARQVRAWLLLLVLPVAAAALLAWAGRGVAAPLAPPRLPAGGPLASIALTKTVATGATCGAASALTVQAGTTVRYCFTVRNTGGVTFETHTLLDSHLGNLFAGPFQLIPGATRVLSYTRAASVSVTNLATWTASPLDNSMGVGVATASAHVTVTAPPLLPAILLTKTVGLAANTCASTTSVAIIQGTPVYFCYTVKNTGNTPLRRHTLTDNRLGTIWNNQPYTLAVGATAAVIQPAAPQTTQINTATWTAGVTTTVGAGSKTSKSDSASVTVTPRALAIAFTKTVGRDNRCADAVDPLTVNPGTRVVYCYRMTNNGNVALAQHKIVDNRLGTITRVQSVAPGASLLITRAATALITTTNTATWTAYLTDTTSPRVSKIDAALVKTPRLPALQFTKTVGTDAHACSTLKSIQIVQGQQAFYCYTAKNVGNVPLALHSLTDAAFAPPILNQLAYTLSVGATIFVTAPVNTQITQTTVATWTAWLTSTASQRVRKTDTATLNVIPNPAKIALRKTVGLAAQTCAASQSILVPAGTVVYYCYTVQNQGPLLLPKHQLYDDDLDRDILPADFLYDLMPMEQVSTANLGIVVAKQITQTTTNFALWQSYINDVLYAQAGARATVRVASAETDVRLTVGAASGPPCPANQVYEGASGDNYALCVVIRNTGGVTLTAHTLSLPALALDQPVTRTIVPGAALTLTRADLPALGPIVLSETRAYSVAVTSTANPSGAPFSTQAQSSAIAATQGAAWRAWLPTVRR